MLRIIRISETVTGKDPVAAVDAISAVRFFRFVSNEGVLFGRECSKDFRENQSGNHDRDSPSFFRQDSTPTGIPDADT